MKLSPVRASGDPLRQQAARDRPAPCARAGHDPRRNRPPAAARPCRRDAVAGNRRGDGARPPAPSDASGSPRRSAATRSLRQARRSHSIRKSRSTAAISLRSPKRACARAMATRCAAPRTCMTRRSSTASSCRTRQASPTGCWRGVRSSNGCRRASCASLQRSARRVEIPTPRSPQPHVSSRSTRSASRVTGC